MIERALQLKDVSQFHRAQYITEDTDPLDQDDCLAAAAAASIT